MNRIDEKFSELKRENKKAFIAFITAGYPNLKTTEKFILEFEKRGVDILELGVPFSDPLADGLTIQHSSEEALKNGTSLKQIISLVRKMRPKVKIPIVLMSYYNPLYAYGLKKLALDSYNVGVDGFIVPDLPMDQAEEFTVCMDKYDIDTIFLATPTTSLQRLEKISKKTKGFLYYVSVAGVTGQRNNVASNVSMGIKMCKSFTDKPVCVGFGVSSPEQIKNVISYSDGAIVGSAIVNVIEKNINDKNLVSKVGHFISEFSEAAHE